MPMEVDGLDELASEFGVNIVAVLVEDWDNALTPWPAKGVFPGDAPFAGNAAETLRELREEVLDPTKTRQLIGISLSGLFAVWAWMQGEDFRDIASISGSFWYDGFPEWLAGPGHRAKSGFAYLSLGDKEGQTRIPRYKPVVRCTAEVEATLRSDGARVEFESVPGTHFAPMLPRLRKALAALPD